MFPLIASADQLLFQGRPAPISISVSKHCTRWAMGGTALSIPAAAGARLRARPSHIDHELDQVEFLDTLKHPTSRNSAA